MDSREFSIMMTYEEAGEVILKNQPWVLYWECSGTGRESENRNFQCSGCAGFKVLLVKDYKRACLLLGKELPKPPETTADGKAGTVIVSEYDEP